MLKLPGKLAGISAAVSVDEAGSFQSDVKHRLQRVVEDWIAGVIGEVGYENAHWWVGGFWLARAYQSKCNHRCHEQNRKGRRCPLPIRLNSRRRKKNRRAAGGGAQPYFQLLGHFPGADESIFGLDLESFHHNVAQCLRQGG